MMHSVQFWTRAIARGCIMSDKSPNGNGHARIEFTPVILLEVILKCVLKDRITDEEVTTICDNFVKTLEEWWE